MPEVTPAEVEMRLEKLHRACRNAGLRMTHQRLEIFREVAMTAEHPDAETIFSRVRGRLPNISHDTVYRTLASLEQLGLIGRVSPVCGRARYDANSDTHHHFICTECGSIADVYVYESIPLPMGLEQLGHAESLHLQVRGICHKCNATNPEE